jgi:prepilin-type N-terminal cleavage/methylation domain-containing protein
MLQKLNSKRGGFTLVEIMIVVAIIALLASIAVPNFLRARKRSQATQVLEDLRLIDAAIDQYAIERNKAGGTDLVWADVMLYLKKDTRLYASNGLDILGNAHNNGDDFLVDTVPVVNDETFEALSDVAPDDFWKPFKAAAATP